MLRLRRPEEWAKWVVNLGAADGSCDQDIARQDNMDRGPLGSNDPANCLVREGGEHRKLLVVFGLEQITSFHSVGNSRLDNFKCELIKTDRNRHILR